MAVITKKIRVAIASLDALESSEYFGIAGSWFFDARFNLRPHNKSYTLGSKEDRFEVYEGTHLTFDKTWSKEIEVDPSDLAIEITFKGTDDDLIYDDDLGDVRAVINLPLHRDYLITLRSSKDYYAVTLNVTILESTEITPGKVTTVVEKKDSEKYNSIHTGVSNKYVHINPVVPVDWIRGVPPIPDPIKKLTSSPQKDFSAPFGSKALNSLVNPALFPIIPTTHEDFANRVARVKITQYWPKNLDLSKLIWRVRSDNIKFWNGKTGVTEIRGGDEVRVYGIGPGTTDTEAYLEVRYDEPLEPLLARYRALVGKPKYISYRAVIVKTTKKDSLNPAVKPSDIEDHIQFTNIILWQGGVLLYPDTDHSTGKGTVHIRDGIYEFDSSTDYTFSQNKNTTAAPIINSRKGVFNLAFIHSETTGTILGRASDRGLSKASTHINLQITPSVSWIRPTGVYPDDPAANASMLTMGPSSRGNDLKNGDISQGEYDTMKALTADGNVNEVSGCFITNDYITDKNPDGSQQWYRTLAHELGHVIGLNHRGSGAGPWPPSSTDEINHQAGPFMGHGHPWDNNFMTYGPHNQSQDMDMIQAKHIRTHPLMKDSKGSPPKPKPPPPPPPKPKEPEPIPGAYHKTLADRILLQEYLIHKRPGLKNGPYDIGITGPDGDGVDGIVGWRTKKGIREFQRDHGGLSIDGIYGPKSRAAFDNEINGAPEL